MGDARIAAKEMDKYLSTKKLKKKTPKKKN